MKYGETLQQRSIPEWGHQNVDYDEIKHIIKEHTTPGNGKAVSIPGQGNTAERAFDSELYRHLADEHQRIDLFVKSKSGEIERRLVHQSQRISTLRTQDEHGIRQRIPAKRLEKYAAIENDVLKAGDDIRKLARFVSAQNTAFAKLLKKHRKWTGSDSLTAQFNANCLHKPGTFSQLPISALLDQYTEVLDAVRAPFKAKNRVGTSLTTNAPAKGVAHDAALAITQLQSAIGDGSEVGFDVAVSAVPLSPTGRRAVYWVHPDHAIELQVLLSQHMRVFVSRSPTSSTPRSSVTPRTLSRRSSVTRVDNNNNQSDRDDDTGLLVLDDIQRYVVVENSSTFSDFESNSGKALIKGLANARWSGKSEAIVVVPTPGRPFRPSDTQSGSKIAKTKRKHLQAYLDVETDFDPRRRRSAASICSDVPEGQAQMGPTIKSFDEVRSWLSERRQVRPIAGVYSKRTRFIGLGNDSSSGTWATLDRDIYMTPSLHRRLSDQEWPSNSCRDGSAFPFLVLEIRQEGNVPSELLQILDESYLTERIRGFSLEAHAVWACCKPKALSPPYWLPVLTSDIRKIPAAERKQRPRPGSSEVLSTHEPISTVTAPSVSGTDGHTSNTSPQITGQSSATSLAEHPDLPAASLAIKKARQGKKKHAHWPGSSAPDTTHNQRYWNEYDNPEDSDDEGYFIYLDPNDSSGFPGADTLAIWVSKVSSFFKPRESINNDETTHLLPGSSHGSDGDESSISSAEGIPPSRPKNYATISTNPNVERSGRGVRVSVFPSYRRNPQTLQNNSQNSILFLSLSAETRRVLFGLLFTLAALMILLILLVLAHAGRRKVREEVDLSIVFGIFSNILFVILAVASLFSGGDSQNDSSWLGNDEGSWGGGRTVSKSSKIFQWIGSGVVVVGFICVVVGDGVLLGWMIE